VILCRGKQRRDYRRGQCDLPAIRQFEGQANFLNVWAKTFTAAHPQATVKLQPIVASENDYYTKLQLSMRSSRTAPDMCYEDTFLINSDISAGYLTPLDDRLNGWPDWSRFNEEAKGAAQALDGKTYGIPDGTDVRALWFNKKLFAQAGLPETWQPKKLERHHDSCPDDQVQGPGLRRLWSRAAPANLILDGVAALIHSSTR
jgi:maltose-binding protein MalE